MSQLEPHSPANDLAVSKNLGDIADRTARHARCSQLFQPLMGCPLRQQSLQAHDQRGAICHPRRIGREPFIGWQLSAPQDSAQTRELPVVANSEHHVAVGSGERLIGHDVRMSRAVPLR